MIIILLTVISLIKTGCPFSQRYIYKVFFIPTIIIPLIILTSKQLQFFDLLKYSINDKSVILWI